MSLRAVGRTILVGLATVALLGLSAPSALSDSPGEAVAKTVEEHQAKVSVYSAKAEQFRKEATLARAQAARYRNARDGKLRKINTPAHRKMIEDLEQMAQDADELANDADRIIFYHERMIESLE